MRKVHVLLALAAILAPVSGWCDAVPDAFTFNPAGDAEPQATVVSNTITVTGIDEASAISITDGEYRIGAGAYTSSPGTVTNQQTVQVRATAGDFEQTVDAVLAIGGVQGTFSVTSRAANSDTVDDSGGDPVLVSTSAGTLMNLANEPDSPYASANYLYPNGFFSFDITGLANGGSATVTITLPSGAAPAYYVKCINNACALFGAAIAGNVVTLSLVDGGAGDGDNTVNGIISDPGAPAVAYSAGGGGGYSSGGYGSLGGLTIVLGLLLAAWRRRSYRGV